MTLPYTAHTWTTGDAVAASSLNAIETNLAATSVLAVLAVQAPVSSAGTLVAQGHNPVDATSANLSEALPTGQSVGTRISAEKTDSSTHTVTLTGNIRGVGSSSIVLSLQHESLELVADAAGSWWPIASHKTLGSLDARYQIIQSMLPVSAASGSPAGLQMTTAGSVRFDLVRGGGAEAGGNSGSDLFIDRCDDGGSYLGSPLIITRATGLVTLESLKVAGAAGFFGTTPISQPTVSGSRGGNVAVANLCTALANLGLIINTTS